MSVFLKAAKSSLNTPLIALTSLVKQIKLVKFVLLRRVAHMSVSLRAATTSPTASSIAVTIPRYV